METSILISTKKILGLGADYTPFDLDVLTHINAAFSILTQLGVGPVNGFTIEDDSSNWEDFIPDGTAAEPTRNLTKTYVYLKVRSLFDPPTTSFHLVAMKEQLAEMEWRLNEFREELTP